MILRRDDLFTVVLEHFQTDTADYADILLPATTQLEHLDIHRAYGHTYAMLNTPAIEPLGECKPFQEVLIELASRLKFPAFTTEQGERKFKDYPDFVINYETAPGSGIGFLTGWRGKDGDKAMRGVLPTGQAVPFGTYLDSLVLTISF